MLLEQAGHWLQERFGLPEPTGDEGKIFAREFCRAGPVPAGSARVVPEGTVQALRQRDDLGYLFSDGTATTALQPRVGELSDQFFERFTRLLGNGEVPLLGLTAGANAAVEQAFGFDTGLIDGTFGGSGFLCQPGGGWLKVMRWIKALR